MSRHLVVKLTHGIDDGTERVFQAFTVAATAIAVGADATVWLTGDAVDVARPGVAEQIELAQAPPLSELLATILEGGQLIVCTQCAARRGLVGEDLLPGVLIAGSATFVEQILAPDAQALVY